MRSILTNQHTFLSQSLSHEHIHTQLARAPALPVTHLEIPSYKPALFYYGLTSRMADSTLRSFF